MSDASLFFFILLAEVEAEILVESGRLRDEYMIGQKLHGVKGSYIEIAPELVFVIRLRLVLVATFGLGTLFQ